VAKIFEIYATDKCKAVGTCTSGSCAEKWITNSYYY